MNEAGLTRWAGLSEEINCGKDGSGDGGKGGGSEGGGPGRLEALQRLGAALDGRRRRGTYRPKSVFRGDRG